MWKTLQDEIQAKAKILTEQGYVYTAKWCNRIYQNLGFYAKNPKELDLDVSDLLSSFENEYLSRTDFGDKELRRKCLRIIQVILEWAIRSGPNLNQTLKELLPLLDRSIIANRPISEVVTVFSKLDDNFLEARIYGSLFVFMLHVDGQYFPMLRTLCALKFAGDGKKFSLKQAEEMTIDEIKKSLGNNCQPLFETYDKDGRHLRNSVAHAHFKYADGKIICWDIDPRSGKETWRREFTYDELSAVIVDIYSINHAYMYWFGLRELIYKVNQHVKRTKPE